jgi:Mg-chelatase subunit ChlD
MRQSGPKAIIIALLFLMAGTGAMPLIAQETAEKEPNNTPAQATALALGTTVAGFANEDEDDDWYALAIPAPGVDALVFELSGIEGVNLVLQFCDATGKALSDVDCFSSGEGESLVRLRQPPGKFLVNVHTDRGGDTEHPYRLRVYKNDRPPATPEEVRQALDKALAFLASSQQEDGSWPSHEIAGAGLATMAFIGGECAGKDHSANIRSALGYLQSQFTPGQQFPAGSAEAAIRGGMFGAVSSKVMYEQAIATLSFIEAFAALNEGSLEPVAEEAIGLIVRSQNSAQKPATLKGPTPPDSPHYGGWRYEPDYEDADLSVSAWQILALRAAVNAGFSVPDRVFKDAAKYVQTLKGADGSFGYDGPADIGDSCARAGMGALALQLCGLAKDPLIAPAVRFMQSYGPTWNFEYPGEGYPFYYWYYGTRVMYLVGGEDWRVWKDYMCRFLVDNQGSKGSWEGAQAEESDALLTYRTAFGALMLEFCCGHVPIYMAAPRVKAPGQVRVVLEKEAEKEAPMTVEIIMDASNSMTGMIGKETKMAAARRVLNQTIEGLPETMNVGLRVYGHRYATDDYDNACRDTELVVPVGPIDKAALTGWVDKIQTKGRTPLVLSVLEAIKDFEKIPNGSIVLVTDGIESCKGDIKSIAPAIKEAGLELKVNIVGFDIKEAEGRQELESIARSTGGRYLDARNADELMGALGQTLKLEFVALDAAGKEAGRGAVGGEAIKLASGNYTIRVLTSPQPVELKVTVKSGEPRELRLKKTAGAWTLQ